jgi:hypothetical protein
MRAPSLGLIAMGVILPALMALGACGSSSDSSAFGGGNGGHSEGGASSGGVSFTNPTGGSDAAFGSSSGAADATFADASSARGTFHAPDCQGCMFPDTTAPSCGTTAPPIRIAYPVNGVLVPPNMNVISVQWTPFGSGFSEFEVDFENRITDTRVITKCTNQTVDTAQPPAASGGCELIVDKATWTLLANANRGLDPVTVTVRGTTDGKCASPSQNNVVMSFANEDVLGSIYYWKSTVTANGTGGQIWVKSFGDSVPESQVTGVAGSALASSCNGCHFLSRDGSRMVVYSDDDDSDDEYSDVTGSLIDMTTKMPIGTAYAGRGSGQPPGLSTFSPNRAYYLTSDGSMVTPTNFLALWNGATGTKITNVTIGTDGQRPTMPDWSPDAMNVVYVLPNKVASWGGGTIFGFGGGARNDDDHEFGGSLYTLPYSGNQVFGTPAVFLASNGENNYYPSYSPDNQWILFDRTPSDKSVSAIDACVTSPHPGCPNDSFSNPAARLELTSSVKGSAVVDLQNANGSPSANPLNLSNSWPRWSPFVQTYKGSTLLWITFSSTRDYGVRVRNHKSGMYQCYPADSFELPGAPHGQAFDPLCQQPQLWMAAINLNEAKGVDPSWVAFWLPFQDITTHNHTPQWTQQTSTLPPPPPPMGCVKMSGDCHANPGACCSPLVCGGNGLCQQVLN